MSQNVEYVTSETVGTKLICEHCHGTFAQKSSLNRHLRDKSCKVLFPTSSKKDMLEEIAELRTRDQQKQEVKELAKELAKEMLANLPVSQNTTLMPASTPIPIPANITNINHQHLNIVCLSDDNDLLEMLIAKEGRHEALTYIKGCALAANLAKDCQILEKVYQQQTGLPTITHEGKSKSKYIYYAKHRRKTFENNGAALAKKLAGILQRSYLKSMDCFRRDSTRQKYAPISYSPPSDTDIPELDEADAETITAHVHELNTEKYQKQLLKLLKIPFEDHIMNPQSETCSSPYILTSSAIGLAPGTYTVVP